MVTFGGKISTEGGITGKGGTIATKEARKKDEAKKKDKNLANLPQYEKELPPKQNIFSKITKGIASLMPSGGGGANRNVTIPNQDVYGKEFKIGNVGGFTLDSGPFGLGTVLYGPKHRLPEFLQQNEGALLQSALNAQRYGTGNINVGSTDKTGNPLRDVITLEGYNPPATAQEFIDNIYQNPNNMVEGILTNNPYFNIARGIGYAGTDENSGLFNTGVAPALRNRGDEGFFRSVQSLMSGRK